MQQQATGGYPLSCTAVRCTHAHSHSPLSRGFRCGGKWHKQCRKAGRFVGGMGDARATTRRTKQSENGQRHASPMQPSRSPASQCLQRDTFRSHTRESRLLKPSAKDRLATTNYSYGRTKAATLKANYLPTYAAVQGSRVQQWTASKVAAAREGPRAAKETLCLRPYVALQAPSPAARKRCCYTKPALRLGLTQGRKGMAYVQARRAATNGRAEHKRLLCQQGSAATIRPAMQIISCQTDSGAWCSSAPAALQKPQANGTPVPKSEWHIP